MRTPGGHESIAGARHARDRLAPSLARRFARTRVALRLRSRVAGVTAFTRMQNRAHEPARRMVRTGIRAAGCARPGANGLVTETEGEPFRKSLR